MKRALLILGAGGHGISVADVAMQTGAWETAHFLDDDQEKSTCYGFPVIGAMDDAKIHKAQYTSAFVAIGNNNLRMQWLEKLNEWGYEIPSLIHPHASIGSMVNIGLGSAVMAGVCVNIGSSIGDGCILNTGCTVDHTNTLEDGVHLSPGVHTGGDVKIGKNTWVCTGVSIGNGVRIASNCIIAAGAAVVHNIEKPGLYAGVPAKLLK